MAKVEANRSIPAIKPLNRAILQQAWEALLTAAV
jgi:hypothetical protein